MISAYIVCMCSYLDSQKTTRIQRELHMFSFVYMSCASVFYLHVCLCEGVRFPGTGVTDSCEPPTGNEPQSSEGAASAPNRWSVILMTLS